MTDCKCDSEYPWECSLHVTCDERCKALNEPQSIDELHAALEHWRKHSNLSGCSHGC